MGWQALPLIIILSSLAGAVIGGSLIAFGRDKTKPIPFGPYLALAGWISLMWGTEITMSYLQFVAL
jgi:leader peptidase (prepilin peptidase)/N-methyltransferase